MPEIRTKAHYSQLLQLSDCFIVVIAQKFEKTGVMHHFAPFFCVFRFHYANK